MKGIVNLETKCDKTFTPVFSKDDNIGQEDKWEGISGNMASKCKFQLESSSWVGHIACLHPKRLKDVLLRTANFIACLGGASIGTAGQESSKENVYI